MTKNLFSGKFIVFEGLDGSGQSTQAKLLREFLIKKGYKVVLTKEPTLDSQTGKKIRKILDKKDYNPPATLRAKPTHSKKEFHKKLQELFAQDRKEHLKKVIIPALKKGKIVISDRYFFSAFAYGGVEGLDLNWLIKINKNFLMPDLTFILKVSPQICLQRILNRENKRTLFEKKSKFIKAWQTYKILPKRFKNVFIIKGEKPIEEVFSQIKNLVRSKLKINS